MTYDPSWPRCFGMSVDRSHVAYPDGDTRFAVQSCEDFGYHKGLNQSTHAATAWLNLACLRNLSHFIALGYEWTCPDLQFLNITFKTRFKITGLLSVGACVRKSAGSCTCRRHDEASALVCGLGYLTAERHLVHEHEVYLCTYSLVYALALYPLATASICHAPAQHVALYNAAPNMLQPISETCI